MTPRDAAAAPALHSRRRVVRAGGGLALVALLGRCGGDDDGSEAPTATPPPATPAVGPVPGFDEPRRWAGRTLRVGAWGGEVQAALRAAVWQPFATATGCEIEEVIADYSQLVAAVRTDERYADAVVVDEVWAETALERNYVLPLELGAATDALAPELPAAPGSVPAYAYGLVSAYRRDTIQEEPPRSWADWWDATRFPGARALARNAFGTFEFALLGDGVLPADLYPLDGPRAIERLRAISGTIVDRWWDAGAQPVSWLGSERTDFASAWHYRVVAGQRDGLAVDLAWEQGLLLTDRWVVPTVAAEPEVALDFLRYALAPEVQAALARAVPLGPVAPAAFSLLDARTAAVLPTSTAALGRLIRPDIAWWAANEVEEEARFNSWLLGTTDG